MEYSLHSARARTPHCILAPKNDRNQNKALIFLWLVVLFMLATGTIPLWAQPTLPVAGDMLTFAGGTQNPGNPDVYEIDMGNYTQGASYSVTINRPKGAQANYPVRMEYTLKNNDYDRTKWESCFELENDESLGSGILEFEAGETSKTIRFFANDETKLPNERATIYLFMGAGSRTKAQYQVVKLHFANPHPVTPLIGADYPTREWFPFSMHPGVPTVGAYLSITAGGSGWGHLEVLDNTRLAITHRSINHEDHPLTVTDSTVATRKTILLKPQQPVGSVNEELTFLFKIDENAIFSNWVTDSDISAYYVLQPDSAVNIKMAKDGTTFPSIKVEERNWMESNAIAILSWPNLEVPPRFGTITTDAASYDKGATVTITLPVLNGKLLQKLHPGNEWLDHIDITLDGGASYLNHAYISFNQANNTITAIAEASNATGSATTVAAEVLYRKFDSEMYDEEGEINEYYLRLREYFLYGANVSFTVTAQQAPFQPVSSIDFTLPKDNTVTINERNKALLARVNPLAATFKTGTWASSHPEVAEISANGILTPKSYGKTTITFTSEEVAYRTANGLPANDETLTPSFDIYVTSDYPYLQILGDHTYYKVDFDENRFYLDNNLKENLWKPDGEVSVKVIHSDSDRYSPITDAFEITEEMIRDGNFNLITYQIPFNEGNFPKIPTLFEASGGDTSWAEPYRLIMSFPLKQVLADKEMTSVLRDTFDLHMKLPDQPVMRLMQNAPVEMMSGDTLLLKYEINYLNKYNSLFDVGFQISIDGGRGWYSSYEGFDGHERFSDNFLCPNEDRLREFYSSKDVEWKLASQAPDWLELTDRGYYYDAVVTVKYKLPAPLGILNAEQYRLDDCFEEFYGSISMENIKGSLGNHPLFGQVLYKTSNPFGEKVRVKAYTADMDLMAKTSWYSCAQPYNNGNVSQPSLDEWEEEGYRIPEILRLVDEANLSGDDSAFETYMKNKAGRNISFYSPARWGELIAGITRTGSNDTIYTVVDPNKKLEVLYPFNGHDYDLIIRYPRQGLQRVYHYSSDSIVGQLYYLSFGHSQSRIVGGKWEIPDKISADYPVNLSYTTGEGVRVDTVKAVNGSNWYILYEPRGIIGDISYRQENLAVNKTLSGVVKPQSLGEGAPALASLSPIGVINNYARLAVKPTFCYNTDSSVIPVSLFDEDTGQRITANARINYLGERDAKAKLSEETPVELVSVEEFLAFLEKEYILIGRDITETRFGESYENPDFITYEANNEETLIKVNAFYQSKVNEYVAQHISASADKYIEGTAGSITDPVNGFYLIPFIKITYSSNGTSYQYDLWDYWADTSADGGYSSERLSGHYLIEVVADGYHPKLTTLDRAKYDEIGEAGLNIMLRKNTEALPQPDVTLWIEKTDVMTSGFWEGIGFNYRYSGNFKVSGIRNYGIHDKEVLTNKGRNSITTFSRYADTQSAVLNVTMPLSTGWQAGDLKLVTQKAAAAPLQYKLIGPSEYPGLENTYANLSYRLNTLVDYGNDEEGNPIAENAVYPDIKKDGITLVELPGLFNDEMDPAVYESEITNELKNSIVLNPGSFDVKSLTAEAKNGSNTDKAMQRAEGFNFSLPDPLPFEFQTRTEGNRYYVRGIMSHNFVDDIPLVGQANMGMSLLARAEEFEAAFNELKGALKMRPKNGTPRHSSAHVFAGLRGYMEGYGEYDPLTHSYEYGINEGGIAVELSASAYVKVPLGLVNVGIGVDGVVSATMGMTKPSDEDWVRRVNKAKFDLWLETQLSLDIRADVSAGLDIGIAGVEVGVTGRAGFKNMNKLVLKPYLPTNDNQFFAAGGYFNVYANMYAWAHAYFLFWSWEDEWKIFDANKTWYYPNNSSNPYLRSGEAPRLRSLSQSYVRSSLAMPNTIIRDVAANAYPRYFGEGNSLMLSNLKTASEQNDDRISVYTSGASGLNDMLPDVKFPAFGFDVATSTNGTSVMAYEQTTDSIRPKGAKVSQEAYLKAQSQNMDVFAAIKNGGEWQTTQLSDRGVDPQTRKTDMAPKVAVSPDGTKAAVIWRSGQTIADATGVKVSGNLLLSRYNGTKWSDTPLQLGSADKLADYSLAVDGDSVLIAAMRLDNDSTGKIKLIYISAADSIQHIETGHTGRKPQIARVDDKYYISFMGQYAKNDTTKANDIYLLASNRKGQPIDSISGFTGMTNKVSFSYKLVSEPVSANVHDLAIVYNASKVINENEIQTSLLASKIGRQDGKFFVSEPVKLLTVPEEQMIIGFDGYKKGNTLKAAATISNENHGAIIVEETTAFENKIVCLSESFNTAEIKSGQDMQVEFEVQNKGFLPANSFSVNIGSRTIDAGKEILMPGAIRIVRATVAVPVNNTDPVNYKITAGFADGSNSVAAGALDLTAYYMKVNLMSLKTSDTKNIAVVEIVNKSASPLTDQHEVTVGIYGDIFGETLYPGTSLKIFPASALYDMGTAKIATAAFDIPIVKEVKSVYAIAKVKKRNLLRSNGEADEMEQAERNYASIQLYPVGENNNSTIPLEPEMNGTADGSVQIYPNPASDVLNLNYQTDVLDRIEISDISGHIIMVENNFTAKSLNVSGLAEGLYFLKLKSKGESLVLKFMKK